MSSIALTPAIRETIERCQLLGNPCALALQGDSCHLVPCFTLEQEQGAAVLKAIDVSSQEQFINSIPVPENLLTALYAAGNFEHSRLEIIVNATFVYPNDEDLTRHLPQEGKELDCEECSRRIASQIALCDIVSDIANNSEPSDKERLSKLAMLIHCCALQALGGSSRPPSVKPPNTPVISPGHSSPSSNTASRPSSQLGPSFTSFTPLG